MQQHPTEEHHDHTFNVIEYINLLRKHLRSIVLCGLIGAVLGFGLYLTKPKLYRAQTKIVIDPMYNDNMNLNDPSNNDYLKFLMRAEYLNTEKERMLSSPIVNRVLEQLEPEEINEYLFAPPPTFSIGGVIQMLRGGPVDPTSLSEEDRLRSAGNALKGGISIREERETLLTTVSFVSRNPEFSAKVATIWVDSYIYYGVAKKLERNQDSFEAVEEQIAAMTAEIADLVKKKNDLAAEGDIVVVGEKDIGDDKVKQMTTKILEEEARRSQLEAQLNALESSDSLNSRVVSEDKRVADLEKRLLDKRNEYNLESRNYGPQHPRIKNINQEIANLERDVTKLRDQVYRDLLQASRSEFNTKKRFISDLQSQLETMQASSTSNRQRLETEIRELEATIEVKSRYVERLNTDKESFDLAIQLKDLQTEDKEVVEAAMVPRGPFSPSLKKFVGLGLFMGVFLCVAIIVLLEITDRKIHNAEMLQKVTGLPTLTAVPLISQKMLIKASDDVKNMAFRDTLEHLEKMEITKEAKGETDQMRNIAAKAVDNKDTGKDARKMSEAKCKDLSKIAALSTRLAKNGVKNAHLERINRETTFAKSLGYNVDEQSQKEKEDKAPGLLSRLLPMGREEAPNEEVAYGEDGSDAIHGLRRVVGCFTHIKPASPFSEAYRHLRTNIQLSNIHEKDQKVFLLTSSVSREGKTISSINLSIAFSQLKKKTLLIDGDLRRAKLHRVFGLPGDIGLVDNMVGLAEINRCVKHTHVPYLDLLASGSIPPNPSELLASDKMSKVMDSLKEYYDFIIIDSPPVLAVTDASILATLADETIFVSKAGRSNRDETARALEILRANNIHPLGALFNSYDINRKAYGKYGYGYGGYGYGRGYGYGYGYSKPKQT